MGVYEKEPLSCSGDKNISNWLRNPKLSCYSSYISLLYVY